ncbi:hypothetical protein RvY_02305 [Ramazzottius varieornatus]|uniref:Uncharacterized protein n=2 Tax=Ramazzottius varieornatus TaxID=947166 RepID=A0A1D1UN09_RAMVA|nr:hypothetical protein RvY_02305 [Ramazzottius varieornatus]
MDITRKIVEHLAKSGAVKTEKQVTTKVHNLVGKWKEAHLAKTGTGFGVNGEGTKNGKALRETILDICKYWDRLDPVFRDRAGMSAPFTGDNEDGVATNVFTLAVTDNTEKTMEFPEGTAEVSAEVPKDRPTSRYSELEDHRSVADKMLDGDYVPSDDEETLTGSPGSASKKRPKKFKSLCDGMDKMPKEKTMDLVGILVASGKERNERAAARNEVMERRFTRELDLKEKELRLNEQRQKDDHETKMEELRIRHQEIDLRKAEMEFKRTEMLLELERLKQQRLQ